MIVRWPGKAEPGSVNDDYLIIEDYFPAILEIAGLDDYLTDQLVDGISFVPQLVGEGTAAGDRSLVFHFPNKWGGTGPGIGTTSTIRKGDWKLIYWYKDQSFELFNITDDIGEQNNLAGREPEILKELASELGVYLRSIGAVRPLFKTTGEPVPWPDELYKPDS